MWDKLMGKIWAIWNIEEYRRKVSVYAVTIASAFIIGIETGKAVVSKWAVIDMFIFVIALTMCICFTIYIVRHKDEWENLDGNKKKAVAEIPHFNAKVFKEITGIDVKGE